jgi:hypothetical protein
MISPYEKAVEFMMRTFNLNYSGWRNDDEGSKAKLWLRFLEEFEPDVINAATGHIIATRKSEYGWAPDIAFVREQCSNLSSGILTTPTGVEAWGHILKKMAEPPGSENRLQLTETEKTALEQVAGKNAIYDLKHGNSSSVSFTRRDFIAAFDSLVDRQRLEIMTPSSVRQLVAKNAPALPAPDTKQLTEDNTTAGQEMSYDQALEEFGPEMNNLKKLIGGE